MIGKEFDDYIITEALDRRNNNQYYKVKCKVCGHEKECSINNLSNQDNHHSNKNCRLDFYKSLIGRCFGDYRCVEVAYDTNGRGCRATLRCDICGHSVNTHASNINDRHHNAHTCESDYHQSMIGKVYGDLKIISVSEEYHGSAILYNCRCVKCGTESKESLASLKGNITHGTHCFKVLPSDEVKTIISRRYRDMYERCNNPTNINYDSYGGRGIKLLYKSAVDLYLDFADELREHLAKDDLRNCTFDRIDVDGNYERSNLRISTQRVQSTNTTRRKVFIIEKDGQRIISDSAMECGRRLGINGRSLGNVIRGNSKSCSGWKLHRIVDANEIIDDVINNEGVTTNMIVC